MWRTDDPLHLRNKDTVWCKKIGGVKLIIFGTEMCKISLMCHDCCERIVQHLDNINWHYGRGEIRYVVIHNMTNDRNIFGTVYNRIPITGSAESQPYKQGRFRVTNNTVFFLNHQRKLK